MFRRSLVAGLIPVAVLSFTGAALAVERVNPAKFALTGFALADAPSLKAVEREASRLTTIGVDGAQLGRDGYSLRLPGTAALLAAHRRGTRGQILITNVDPDTHGFRPENASVLLRDPLRRARMAVQIGKIVRAQGWDGVVIDLEALTNGDRSGLVSFVRAVKQTVPGGRRVTVAIPAFDQAGHPGRRPYDAKSIGLIADEVLLMTYAQHTARAGSPGPIGGLPWMKRAIAVMKQDVSPKQLRLGIAAYGTLFGPNRRGGDVTVDAARKLVQGAGARPVWNAQQGEWMARIGKGQTVWWSDERSVAARIALARKMTPGGAGIWRLAAAPVLSASVVGGPVERRGDIG